MLRRLVKAACVAVVALITLSCVAVPGSSSSVEPLATATAAPSPSPTSTARPSDAALDGIRVHSVSELLDARANASIKGDPTALRGFWSDRSVAHSCAAPDGQPGELEIYCHDGEFGITERNEPIRTYTVDFRFILAEGPHLTPWAPESLAAPLLNTPVINNQWFPPVPIVVVGHFDDERVTLCRPEFRKRCADRFVIDRIVDYRPEAVPTPGVTPSPSPFPFGSPPPAPFDVAGCAGDGPYSFVGWITGGELGLDQSIPATVYAAVTEDGIQIGDWIDAPGDTKGRFRTMGRRVCFAAEYEVGEMTFAWVPGSAYREWEDGHRTPLNP